MFVSLLSSILFFTIIAWCLYGLRPLIAAEQTAIVAILARNIVQSAKHSSSGKSAIADHGIHL